MRTSQQIFISYSTADRKTANRVATALRDSGARVWFFDWALDPGDSIAEKIEDGLSSSDLLLLLLSKSAVESRWVQHEWTTMLSAQLSNRAVTVFPVLIEDCKPPRELADLQLFDLRADFERNLARLVSQIRVVPDVDFSQISNEQQFLDLVRDLLSALRFQNIKEGSLGRDRRFDLCAQFRAEDPFGHARSLDWVFDLKLYRENRLSIASVKKVVSILRKVPGNKPCGLITTGQINSVVRDYIENINQTEHVDIRVVDGTELRRLLLRFPEVVDQHFGKEST